MNSDSEEGELPEEIGEAASEGEFETRMDSVFRRAPESH
jgi:hypothetical protein